jgi:hypothetical protein
MNEANDRDAAWDAVHEALPANWRVGLPSYSPERRSWSVTAIDELTTRRGKIPQTVGGTGEDEVAALHDLAECLADVPRTEGRLDQLRRRIHAVYPLASR